MPKTVSLEDLRRLTVGQLMDVIPPPIPRTMKRNKSSLVEHIHHHFSDEVQQRYHHVMENSSTRRIRSGHAPPRAQATSYMQLPTKEEMLQSYKDFFTATSGPALARAVCAVCAREMNCESARFMMVHPHELPNRERLHPATPHPHQQLMEGMLLELQGVVDKKLRICASCFGELSSSQSGPPKYSLANDLWTGPIPPELSSLTVAEERLIALVYPRVFVYKLFPRRPGADPETLQRSMKGTVCSFSMNMDAISNMISGSLMPRPPAILASVISVTFVGAGSFPKKWLKKTFRVRRNVVRAALIWLKHNNVEYYGHIQLSEQRLALLPEDDVPDQISGLLRRAADNEVIFEEHGGYAPNSGLDLDAALGEEIEPDEEQVDNEGNPVFPILASGMVDSDLNSVSQSELFQWAVTNLTGTEGEEGWYGVRHGKDPVRDFGPRGNSANTTDFDYSGSLSLFNLYVALSRSSGRQTIRLLRDFDANALMKGHLDLLAEDDRIRRLDEVTKSWFLAVRNM